MMAVNDVHHIRRRARLQDEGQFIILGMTAGRDWWSQIEEAIRSKVLLLLLKARPQVGIAWKRLRNSDGHAAPFSRVPLVTG